MLAGGLFSLACSPFPSRPLATGFRISLFIPSGFYRRPEPIRLDVAKSLILLINYPSSFADYSRRSPYE